LRGSRLAGVAAEDSEEVGEFFEVAEGALNAEILGAAEQVDVEEVLPGAAAEGARFDFGEAEIAEGEGAEGLEKRARLIPGGENKGGLPALFGRPGGGEGGLSGAAEEEEAGVVFAVILDGFLEDPCAVDLGGDGGGDGGGIAEAVGHDHFDAAGGVVEGGSFELGVSGEKVEALIEGNGVGEDTAEILEPDARGSDEVMDDADVGFAGDVVVEVEEVVVVLVDGAVEGIFDGDDGGVAVGVAEGGEDVLEAGTGENLGVRAGEAHDGFMAEGAGLTLEGDTDGDRALFHGSLPEERGKSGASS